MKRSALKTLARDPRFISGIYNYCDRWCERCPLSNRCLNYAIELADRDDDGPRSRDLTNSRSGKKGSELTIGTRLTTGVQAQHEMAEIERFVVAVGDEVRIDSIEAVAAAKRKSGKGKECGVVLIHLTFVLRKR